MVRSSCDVIGPAASVDMISSTMSSDKFNRSIDLSGLRRVREVTVNFTQSSSSYISSSALRMSMTSGTRYAIITTNAIVKASNVLHRFMSHKETLGFSVQLVTEDDFGGGPATRPW